MQRALTKAGIQPGADAAAVALALASAPAPGSVTLRTSAAARPPTPDSFLRKLKHTHVVYTSATGVLHSTETEPGAVHLLCRCAALATRVSSHGQLSCVHSSASHWPLVTATVLGDAQQHAQCRQQHLMASVRSSYDCRTAAVGLEGG